MHVLLTLSAGVFLVTWRADEYVTRLCHYCLSNFQIRQLNLHLNPLVLFERKNLTFCDVICLKWANKKQIIVTRTNDIFQL